MYHQRHLITININIIILITVVVIIIITIIIIILITIILILIIITAIIIINSIILLQSNPFRGSQTKDMDVELRPVAGMMSPGSRYYPKTLRTSCLHRALDINKVSKKMAFKNLKVEHIPSVL